MESPAYLATAQPVSRRHQGLNVLLNFARLVLAGIWTTILGVPLLVCLYVRYAFGLLSATLGRRDMLDRALEANAHLAGWVAQRLWTGVLLAIAGIRLRVRELVPVDWTAAHVICANHASILDIVALVRIVPPPFRFVAKRELVKWPIIGWSLRPAGQIVIDRTNRRRALHTIAEAAARKIRGQVIFFVEGTRTRTGQLLPFKKGAFHFAIENHLPILPIAVCGSYATLAKVPWWRMNPGRDIEILVCRTIAPPPVPEHDGAGVVVESLLLATREQIAGALAAAEV
jgi:1-acyl-sn-glycerol-3-phosphate acyltransferase